MILEIFKNEKFADNYFEVNHKVVKVVTNYRQTVSWQVVPIEPTTVRIIGASALNGYYTSRKGVKRVKSWSVKAWIVEDRAGNTFHIVRESSDK